MHLLIYSQINKRIQDIYSIRNKSIHQSCTICGGNRFSTTLQDKGPFAEEEGPILVQEYMVPILVQSDIPGHYTQVQVNRTAREGGLPICLGRQGPSRRNGGYLCVQDVRVTLGGTGAPYMSRMAGFLQEKGGLPICLGCQGPSKRKGALYLTGTTGSTYISSRQGPSRGKGSPYMSRMSGYSTKKGNSLYVQECMVLQD